MNVEAKPFGALPCELETFKINGVECQKNWFISMDSDNCPEGCEGYDCHNMHAVALDLDEVRHSIKGKIDLDDNEILKVQTILVEVLNVGDCGWCV